MQAVTTDFNQNSTGVRETTIRLNLCIVDTPLPLDSRALVPRLHLYWARFSTPNGGARLRGYRVTPYDMTRAVFRIIYNRKDSWLVGVFMGGN